ncbi:phage portal protein [uncultured Anaerococcus sp.]|mgnify:CR=1 FL=1|uniref:phage portal protein n=1 Tax=uncultured Anaerococcus sp. TaxID=293428 RepID=UPI00262BC843|nr:phage portal protein [uncultured Anaerococcus sp.]
MLENEIRKIYRAEQNDIQNNHQIWLDCYQGDPYWLNNIIDPEDKLSLNLPVGITSELARLTVIELESEVSDDNLNEIYQKLLKQIRRITEYGLALGGIMLKPYIENVESKKIDIDIVPANRFLVLGYTSFGDANHVVFIDRIQKIDKKGNPIYFTRLEEHQIKDKYIITNSAYMSKDINSLGDEISLEFIDEWADIKEDAEIDSEIPLFAYFKNPQSNNLDIESYDGISCFARAISLIQDADEQYQRIMWEYRGSELAIDADVTLLKQSGDLPKGKDRLFRNLGRDYDGDFYQVFSPTIRDSSLFNGLNKILEKIEFVSGLAYGTLSELQETSKTATEIKASKQRSYSTVKDIQNEMESTLRDFIDILAFWCKQLNINIDEKYTVSFDWDDSIVVDSETERLAKIQEVAAGLLSPEAYIKRRYGVDDEGVKEYLPNAEESDRDILEEE